LVDALECGQDPHSEPLVNGVHVLMLPFGTRCKFLGEESRILGAIELERPFKISTRAWLRDYGIPMEQESRWVYLEFGKNNHRDKDSSNGAAVCRVWWPAHLCFIKHTSRKQKDSQMLKDIITGSFLDPLEDVEHWFLGRQEREAIIEARRKEVEETKCQTDRAPNQEDSEIEDDGADAITQANQYLSAQEASGIYPTPPDGLASNAQGSIATQHTPSASMAGGHLHNDAISAAAHSEIAEIDSPDRIMSRAPYAGDESEGFFGDMDDDMFDTHNLTEADFNFFDEPDGTEGQAELTEPDTQDAEDMRIHPSDGELSDVLPIDALVSDITPLASENVANASVVKSLTHRRSPNKHTVSDGPPATLDLSQKASGVELQAGDSSSAVMHPEILQSPPANLMEAPDSYNLTLLDNPHGGFYRKYGHAGKYATSSPEAHDGMRPGEDRQANNQAIPSLGLLHERSQDSSQESDFSGSDLQSLTDGDDAADWSDTAGAVNVDMNSAPSKDTTRKRKREPSSGSNAPATPTSVPAFQAGLDSSANLDWCMDNGYFDYNVSIDISEFMEDDDIAPDCVYFGNDQEFIGIAQLVADQAIQNTDSSRILSNFMEEKGCWSPPLQHNASELPSDIISRKFPEIQHCDLKSFFELDPTTASRGSQQTSLQTPGITGRNEVFYETRLPYLNVRRGQDTMDIAPPALYFWQELGLAPLQQSRDVEALCIYPENPAVRVAASTFLTALEHSYQGCKFGLHQPCTGHKKAQEGLLPVSITSTNPEIIADSFDEACESLGMGIPLKEADGTNIVVYFVDPFDSDASHPYICAAFQKLQDAYALSAQKAGLRPSMAMALQIVPLSFLASEDCLAIPPPKAYTKLAFEVYSRCKSGPSSDGTMPDPFTSGSAIRLAKPIPKTVSFQLSSHPMGSLLSPDTCLHLAYSWDIDRQWLSCAWMDNLGATQWNAVYCLGDPNADYWAAFAETVKEVLDTTRELLQLTSMPWRLYIVKDTYFHWRELDIWRLHSAPITRPQNTISFISIDTEPTLCFSNGQMINITGQNPLDISSAAFTPNEQILTPGGTSPNVNNAPSRAGQNPPATPSANGFSENDPSARLVDIVSQTWALISPNPILDPCKPRGQCSPVLVSGYLLKRAGTEDRDGLISLGINLVNIITPKVELGDHQAHTNILTEVLQMYSDLATLARLRGLEEWKSGVLPWHVAAARKAKKTVTRCMRWEEKE
ncbi:MAG: hypothetical protein Q9180_004525, partial [Flavoplaca navasiana]